MHLFYQRISLVTLFKTKMKTNFVRLTGGANCDADSASTRDASIPHRTSSSSPRCSASNLGSSLLIHLGKQQKITQVLGALTQRMPRYLGDLDGVII